MKVFDYYDEKNAKDYVWYNSDNLYYSEAIENNDGTINLKIIFKQGATYLYYKVSKIDYLAVKNNDSNGVAFSTFINKKIGDKPKYLYKRIDDTSIAEIDDLRKKLEEYAFCEQEKQINTEQPNTNRENEVINQKDVYTSSSRNECLIRFDKDEYRIVVELNGKEISKTHCADKERFMQMAFFITPIISNLGGIVNFDEK